MEDARMTFVEAPPTETTYRWMDSPFGRILLAGDAAGLREIRVERPGGTVRPEAGWEAVADGLRDEAEQLAAYFEGRLRGFSMKLAPQGTPFQLDVWKAVESVPYGRTTSYGEIASRVGRPSAVRAVGAANGANPLPIVVPCHRIIGGDGRLTGYGGGLDMKAALLDLERGARSLL
jgi:methylated-DNA-[protein]-cysteine S-methyltransferase